MARINLTELANAIPKGVKNAATLIEISSKSSVGTATLKNYLTRFENDGQIKSLVVEREGRGRNPVAYYRTKNIPKKYLEQF